MGGGSAAKACACACARSVLVLAAAACAFAVAAQRAAASEILARDATNVMLRVNAKGEALVSYTEAGRARKLLAWGAVNAIAPTTSRAQVAFGLDYAGGWGKYRSA